MQAFEITRTWSEVPVTVFAPTLDDATRIYRDWVEAHHPHQPAEPEMIYPYGGQWLKARVLLGEAVRLNIAGVGYWIPSEYRWSIRSPTDKPLGELAANETRVAYYRVEAEEGEDAMVFAGSFEQATSIYCVFHLDRWGEMPTRFSLRKMSRWSLVGEFVTVRDGMAAEITGVALRDGHGQWRILPPDYEPSYTRG
jgi:hypothetical protein